MKKVLFTLVAMLFAVAAFADSGRYTATPQSGSTLKSISVVTLHFLEKTQSSVNSQILVDAIINDVTGNSVGNMLISADGTGGVVLSAQTPVTTDGNYTVTIPAGTIIFGLDMSTFQFDTNDEVKLHYTVKATGSDTGGGEADGPYTMVPAKGETVASFSSFTLTFNEANDVKFNSSAFDDPYVYVLKDGIACAGFYKSAFDNKGGKTVTGSLSASMQAVLTEVGDYSFTIPAGVYTIDGVPSEEIVFSFTVDPSGVGPTKPEVLYSTTPTNMAEVENFKSLIIAFSGSEATKSHFDEGGFTVKVVDVVGATIAKAYSVQKQSSNRYAVNFSAETGKNDYFTNGQLTKPGVYKVLLPAGLFTHTYDGFDDEDDSEAIEVQFTIPGGGEDLPYVNANIGYTINPSNGSTITDETKNTFTITFDAPVVLDMNATYLTSGSQIIEFVNVRNEGNAYTFTFPSTWLTDVQYRVKEINAEIAANDPVSGHRILGNAGEGENSIITLHYDVNIGGEAGPDLTPTLTPASGSSVEVLKTVTVRYNGLAGFDIDDDDDDTWVSLLDATGTPVAYAEEIDVADGGFDISFVAVPAGTYTMVVSAGLFRYKATDDGEFKPLPEVRASYTVTKGEEIPVIPAKFTATPADGSTVAECASICFVYDGEVDYGEAVLFVAPVLTNAAGEEVELEECELTPAEDGEATQMVATPVAALANGTYNFSVPERFLMSFDAEGMPVAYLAAHQVTFTVQTSSDGVQTITVLPEGEGAAYDVAGRRIGKGYQGIFIRQGQKTIRK